MRVVIFYEISEYIIEEKMIHRPPVITILAPVM